MLTLAAFAIVLAYIAFRAPIHIVVAAGILAGVFRGDGELFGVRIDISDVAMAAVLLRLYLRRDNRESGKARIPYFGLWVAYGVLTSIAYLKAPGTQDYLSSPAAVIYQLYRYCWKPTLYYPLAVLYLTRPQSRLPVLIAIIAAADFCGAEAILQGYTGMEPVGTLGQKNELAGALLFPMIFALKGFLAPESPRLRRFYALSGVILARALLISGSHGAFIAAVISLGLFSLAAMRVASARVRVTRLGLIGVLAVALLVSWNPNITERPALKYTITSHDETFRWRIEERWPHFWELMWQRPLFGWGTDVDASLGSEANTPHNGFLAVGVKSGVPAGVLFISFVTMWLWTSFRKYLEASKGEPKLFAAAVTSCAIAFVAHNSVDSTIGLTFIAIQVWMLMGMSASRAPAVVAKRVTEASAATYRAVSQPAFERR